MFKRTFITLFAAICLFCIFGASAIGVTKDLNADTFDDILAAYRYNNAATAVWALNSNGTNFAASKLWATGPWSWDASRSSIEIGNFAGDARADYAILYDYGSSTSAIWLFETTDAAYTPRLAWTSGPGSWDASRSKLAAGDFAGVDGYDDLAILYDYGNSTSGWWIFQSNGTVFTPQLAWSSGAGNWDASRCRLTVGDFYGDPHDDTAILYDYGNAGSGAWIFEANGTGGFSPRSGWASPAGSWDAARSKLTAGNFAGDARDDLAILYDYGSATSAVWVFQNAAGSFGPAKTWTAGPGSWDSARSKVTAGRYSGGAYDDLGIFYDYGNGVSADWTFQAGAAPHLAWATNAGQWEWTRTKLAGGATFLPRFGPATGKSIDVNLSTQTLTCNALLQYEQQEGVFTLVPAAVFSTLVSSGRSPFDTPTGSYYVYAKDVVGDMAGFAGTAEEYYVPSVPYILWFSGGYSIHGAYWHNDFGSVRSHGCVNVPVDAGAWIFNWAPVGTPVSVHY